MWRHEAGHACQHSSWKPCKTLARTGSTPTMHADIPHGLHCRRLARTGSTQAAWKTKMSSCWWVWCWVWPSTMLCCWTSPCPWPSTASSLGSPAPSETCRTWNPPWANPSRPCFSTKVSMSEVKSSNEHNNSNNYNAFQLTMS